MRRGEPFLCINRGNLPEFLPKGFVISVEGCPQGKFFCQKKHFHETISPSHPDNFLLLATPSFLVFSFQFPTYFLRIQSSYPSKKRGSRPKAAPPAKRDHAQRKAGHWLAEQRSETNQTLSSGLFGLRSAVVDTEGGNNSCSRQAGHAVDSLPAAGRQDTQVACALK